MKAQWLSLSIALTAAACGESSSEDEGPGAVAEEDASLGCWYDGKVYAPNEAAKMDCNTCWCVGGTDWECELQDCSSEPDKPRCSFGASEFLLDDRVLCPDGCNTCTCTADEFGAADWVRTDELCNPVSPVARCEESSYERVPARAMYLEDDRLLLAIDCAPGVFRVCWDGSVLEGEPSEVRLWVENLDRTAPCELDGLGSKECSTPCPFAMRRRVRSGFAWMTPRYPTPGDRSRARSASRRTRRSRRRCGASRVAPD